MPFVRPGAHVLAVRASIEAGDVGNYDCFARAESAGLGWKFNYAPTWQK